MVVTHLATARLDVSKAGLAVTIKAIHMAEIVTLSHGSGVQLEPQHHGLVAVVMHLAMIMVVVVPVAQLHGLTVMLEAMDMANRVVDTAGHQEALHHGNNKLPRHLLLVASLATAMVGILVRPATTRTLRSLLLLLWVLLPAWVLCSSSMLLHQEEAHLRLRRRATMLHLQYVSSIPSV
jgi:hypothetical protein